jgi:site-specific recombinase XerD
VLPVNPVKTPQDAEPLDGFLRDWRVHLRAKGRRPRTIESYLAVAESFCGYLREHNLPDAVTTVKRSHIEIYLADMHERVSPATVAKAYRSLQQLFRWLVEDGELELSPMLGMSAPHIPEQPVPIIELEDLTALLATCKGNTFEQRRDLAVMRLFLDTGMRASELIGLTVDDIDPRAVHRLRDGQRWSRSSMSLRRPDRRRGAQVHARAGPAPACRDH